MESRTALRLVVGAQTRAPREPSEVPKATCPWCGGQRSRVYRSKGAMTSDEYRRRRRCLEVDCGRTWPTLEGLDKVRFARELALAGVSPAELDLELEPAA